MAEARHEPARGGRGGRRDAELRLARGEPERIARPEYGRDPREPGREHREVLAIAGQQHRAQQVRRVRLAEHGRGDRRARVAHLRLEQDREEAEQAAALDRLQVPEPLAEQREAEHEQPHRRGEGEDPAQGLPEQELREAGDDEADPGGVQRAQRHLRARR